jgi:hypothetical protein
MKCELCNGFSIVLCKCETKECGVCYGSGVESKGIRVSNNPRCGMCSGSGQRMTLDYRGNYVINSCGACGGGGRINYGSYTSYNSCLRCFGFRRIPVFGKKCDLCNSSGYLKCKCTLKKTYLPSKNKSKYMYK